MIDIEEIVIDKVRSAVKEFDPKCSVTTGRNSDKPAIPSVEIAETHNAMLNRLTTDDHAEHYAELSYTIKIYTSGTAKKRKAKEFAQVIDTLMVSTGFYRTGKRMDDRFNDAETLITTLSYRAIAGETPDGSDTITLYKR